MAKKAKQKGKEPGESKYAKKKRYYAKLAKSLGLSPDTPYPIIQMNLGKPQVKVKRS